MPIPANVTRRQQGIAALVLRGPNVALASLIVREPPFVGQDLLELTERGIEVSRFAGLLCFAEQCARKCPAGQSRDFRRQLTVDQSERMLHSLHGRTRARCPQMDVRWKLHVRYNAVDGGSVPIWVASDACYPDATVVVHNLGGDIPYEVERMDHRCLLDTPDEELPSARFRRAATVYVDCNSFGPRAIEAAVRARSAVLLRLDALMSGGGASYDYDTITVEHVLPQNPKADSEWTKWFPDAQKRLEIVHSLGNLALLTRKKNASASNWEFDRKKMAYFAKGACPRLCSRPRY